MATPDPNRRTHKTHAPPLSAREIRFCQLWVEGGNATRSYIDAGFPHKSENVAAQLSRRLLRKVQIRTFIRHLQHVAAAAAEVTTAEIVAAIANVAKADRRKLFDARGVMLPPDQWPDDVAATVEGIETEELVEPIRGVKGVKGKRLKGYTRKVKTGSRLAAWAKLAEIKGLTGVKKDEPPPEGKKNAVVVEVELGPDRVEPPAEGA
jgi:phage terminase small subunit